MSTGDFLQDFELSMKNLEEAKQNIENSVKSREKFTNNLKSSLTEINKKLGELVGDISKLKQTADELQSNVDTNNNSIVEKQKQIEVLTQQLSASKKECDAAIVQANQEKQQLQSTIDTYEANLRAITSDKEALLAEKEALKKELQDKGDLSGQHAATIEKMTQDAQLLAQQKEQEFQQREKELNDRIATFEGQIQELEKQIREKDAEIVRIKQDHELVQGNANSNLTALQAQIDELKEENEELAERIVRATQAINSAVDVLNSITESAPNARSQEEITALLGEIEKTIENIARAIQGQRAAAPSAPSGPSGPSGPSSTQPVLQVDTPITVQGTTKPLADWINELKAKIKQANNNNPKYVPKYQEVLNNLYKASTHDDAATSINKIYKNGIISGGRRTKKNRKQKGGFTYKPTSTRRSISSTPTSNRHFTRRNSRRSSRRYSKSSR